VSPWAGGRRERAARVAQGGGTPGRCAAAAAAAAAPLPAFAPLKHPGQPPVKARSGAPPPSPPAPAAPRPPRGPPCSGTPPATARRPGRARSGQTPVNAAPDDDPGPFAEPLRAAACFRPLPRPAAGPMPQPPAGSTRPPHLARQQDVLARLRHRPVGGGHHQDGAVHLGGGRGSRGAGRAGGQDGLVRACVLGVGAHARAPMLCPSSPSNPPHTNPTRAYLRRARDHVLDIVRVPRAVHVRVVAVGGLVLDWGPGGGGRKRWGSVQRGCKRPRCSRRRPLPPPRQLPLLDGQVQQAVDPPIKPPTPPWDAEMVMPRAFSSGAYAGWGHKAAASALRLARCAAAGAPAAAARCRRCSCHPLLCGPPQTWRAARLRRPPTLTTPPRPPQPPPRPRALSIWSNGTAALVASASDSTRVIAAVSVVFPWSTWPIVPTLTWGLVRLLMS
jgi:hypothetical protein